MKHAVCFYEEKDVPSAVGSRTVRGLGEVISGRSFPHTVQCVEATARTCDLSVHRRQALPLAPGRPFCVLLWDALFFSSFWENATTGCLFHALYSHILLILLFEKNITNIVREKIVLQNAFLFIFSLLFSDNTVVWSAMSFLFSLFPFCFRENTWQSTWIRRNKKSRSWNRNNICKTCNYTQATIYLLFYEWKMIGTALLLIRSGS